MKFVNRIVIAAASVAFGLSASTARAADVDMLLPAESEQVFSVNLKQMLESDLIKKYALASIKQALEGNDAQKQLKSLGMDPLKDIDTLSGGLWGEDAQNIKGLFIARGNFDPKKIFETAEAAAKKDGDKVSIVKDGDYTFVKVAMDNRPEPIFMSVADEKTVLIGTDKPILVTAMKAIDKKATAPAIKKELADLIATMDSKASMYFCGLSNGKVGEIPPNPLFDDTEKLKKQLQKLESSSMTLRVTGDVSLEFLMAMKDGDAADDFGSTVDELLGKVKAFLPLAAMQDANFKPVVTDVTKSLKSKVDKKTITIVMKVTGSAIGQAAGTDE